MLVKYITKIIKTDITRIGDNESMLQIYYLNDDNEEEVFIFRHFNNKVIGFIDELNILRLMLEDEIHFQITNEINDKLKGGVM
jgi:hypothetical protein